MESHKRTLAILHIIYGGLTLSVAIIANTIFRSVLPFIAAEMNSEEMMFFSTFGHVIQSVVIFLLLLIPLPSVIGGIALLNGKKWGLTLILISGSLSLLSFPIGMALGAYTIWVFVKSGQEKALNDQNQG